MVSKPNGMKTHIQNLKVGTLILVAILALHSCDETFTEIIDEYGMDTGKVLSDTTLTIDPSSQDVEVSFEKVQIKVPKYAILDSALLIIKEYDPAGEKPLEDFDYGPVYDITIEGHEQFRMDIFISLEFDNEQVPEKFEKGIIPMYYNDSLDKWEQFLRYEVDTLNNQVLITTRHLTKVSWWNPNRYSGYTDLFSTGIVNIYYGKSNIPSNSTFSSPNASLYALSKTPHYIEDMAKYLGKAYVRYASSFPAWYRGGLSQTFSIFIDNLGSAEGKKDFITNSIYIDNRLKHSDLKSVCAHELMHLLQDDYYNMAGSSITNAHWWLEATAVNADRFVWQNWLTDKETETYEHFSDLVQNLDKSWDDCDAEPNFYRAGCFISYLTWYRKTIREGGTGPFLKGYNLDAMLIYVGENGPLSSVAETLDEYIQSQGDTLGVLYNEFLRWVITQSGDQQLFLTDQRGYDQLWQEKVEINNGQYGLNASQSIPSLGVRNFKIFNIYEPADRISVDILNQGPDVKIYYSGEKRDGNIFKLVSGPTSHSSNGPFAIPCYGDDRCVDIICINQNNSSAQNVSLNLNALFKFQRFRFNITLNPETPGNPMDIEFNISPNYGDVIIESRTQEGLTMTVEALMSQTLDFPKTTLKLTMNEDCSEIIKAEVHAYIHVVIYGNTEYYSTVDFTIENFPLSILENGLRSNSISGIEVWKNLTHFSLKNGNSTYSAARNKAGFIEIEIS